MRFHVSGIVVVSVNSSGDGVTGEGVIGDGVKSTVNVITLLSNSGEESVTDSKGEPGVGNDELLHEGPLVDDPVAHGRFVPL